MFTGIVKGIGQVVTVTPAGGDKRFEIGAPCLKGCRMALGDSISVAGVCLTVTEVADGGFACDLSQETLQLSTLGDMDAGANVNIEPALSAGEPLGGHWVSGHIDGVATLVSMESSGRSQVMRFRVPRNLARYIAPKGSVTLDGVSLTVNGVDGDEFDINVIPHTLEVTTLGELAVGAPANIEVDILARYLERLIEAREQP